MINLIVAEANNHVIGNKNDLPWYLPADLKHFKDITTGNCVIMGWNTYKSIYQRLSHALPNRQNIVVSDFPTDLPEGFALANSLGNAIQAGKKSGKEIFVIGGATLFNESIKNNLIDRVYLTKIDTDIDGDTFFTELRPDDWRVTDKTDYKPDEKNKYPYSFITLVRTGKA